MSRSKDAVDSLKLWFQHLETEAIEVPKKAGKAGEEKPTNAPPPLSIYALAATTARVASEVADGVYDALYRAALENGFNPKALLARSACCSTASRIARAAQSRQRHPLQDLAFRFAQTHPHPFAGEPDGDHSATL